MKLRTYVEAVAFTVLSILAGIVVARAVWQGWDSLVEYLMSQGAPFYTGSILAGIVFVVAVYLGALQLKRFQRN